MFLTGLQLLISKSTSNTLSSNTKGEVQVLTIDRDWHVKQSS